MSNNDRGPKRESWLFSQFVRHRRPFQMGIDATAWAVAVPVASFLRHDFDAGSLRVGGLVLYVVLAWAVQGAVGMSEGLYRGRFSFGSFEEVAALARTSVVVTAIGAAVNQLAFPDRLPSINEVQQTVGGGRSRAIRLRGLLNGGSDDEADRESEAAVSA